MWRSQRLVPRISNSMEKPKVIIHAKTLDTLDVLLPSQSIASGSQLLLPPVNNPATKLVILFYIKVHSPIEVAELQIDTDRFGSSFAAILEPCVIDFDCANCSRKRVIVNIKIERSRGCCDPHVGKGMFIFPAPILCFLNSSSSVDQTKPEVIGVSNLC